jgi:hypothetical protein
MILLKKIKSAARGALWIIRPSGLRHSLVLNEERMNHYSKSLAIFEDNINYRLAKTLMEAKREAELARWRKVGDLRAFERTVFSQNGEDGIIQEILRRIGVQNKFFVEFGVETGEVCNCARLAVEEHWEGLFIEARRDQFEKLTERYRSNPKIRCANHYISSTNIECILADNKVPADLDLLSIDIDGNDYWVWAAINHWHPRMVVIEYNPTKGPAQKWVMAENPNHVWDGTNYFGASLASLKELGKKKGYTLVATDSRGVNAFFVRDDLVGEGRFLDPLVQYHFSELNHPLLPQGVPHREGPFVEI